MASSVVAGVPLWVDYVSDDATTPLRTFEVGTRVYDSGSPSAVQVPSGVFPGGGAMAVTAPSGMQVQVSAGYCCLGQRSSSGGYIFGLTSSAILTLQPSNPALPRIDNVIAAVYDNGDSSSYSDVEITTGVPGTNPVAPAVPANAVLLAQVYVAAGTSSITSSAITDERTFVVAPGGVIPISGEASAPAVPGSQLMLDLSTGQLVQGTGTAGQTDPVPVLKWAPQMAVVTTAVSDSAAKGALTTIATVTITADGSTDLEVYYKWPGWIVSAAPLLVTPQVLIDGAALDQTDCYPVSTSVPTGGSSVRAFTSAGQANTPAAGTHTVTFAFQSASTSVTTTMEASSTAKAILRVTPIVT
ncbi:MAG: hypothetical protein ACRDP5_15875 [Streptosporangiaceae bacterium]